MSKNGRYQYVIDVSKCYGCMSCVAACASENNVPIGVFRTWVERFVKEDGQNFFLPKLCNHCDNPTCVTACPVKATYKREDGLVLIDDEKCIGCGACIQACPYGARFFNPVKGVADKCTYCSHRIPGKLPACVEVCPTSARMFFKKSETKLHMHVLKPNTGNKPQVYYLNYEGVE